MGMEKELQSSSRKSKVVSRIKGTSATLDVVKSQDGSDIVVKKLKKNIGVEEGKKNTLINEQLEDVEGVKAPEIFDYSRDKVVMEYMNSISFEKYYIKHLRDERRIKRKLRYIAKALSSIHSISRNSKEEEVFVHGDFHPENILIEKGSEDVVIIDAPSSVYKDKKYRDLALFMYHLNFKIPYKYYSPLAYFKSSSYIEYFFREYCKYFKEGLDLEELGRWRIWNLQNYMEKVKKRKRNFFLKYCIILHLKCKIFILKNFKSKPF